MAQPAVAPDEDFREDAAGGRRVRPRAPRVRSYHARIAGSDAHWLACGQGDPVVLVHGLGNSSLVWRRVIAGLARNHRVIAPDLPGFGHSSPVHTHRLLEAYADFVAELIEHVAQPRAGARRGGSTPTPAFPAGGGPNAGVSPGAGVSATLVGNSTGGAVALRVALTRTELVSRLVLVDPAGVGQGVPSWWRLVRFEGAVRALSAVPLALTPRPVLERIIGEAYRRMAFADPGNVSERSVRLFAERLNNRERIHRFLRSARDVVDAFERDVQTLERPLPVPVLAVWGREDRLVPLQDALVLLERLGHLQVRIIEDCGHSPQLERPDAFLDAIAGFLASRPRV
jgi:pimeloyl-ACP methyl ester carboxylesterase